MRSEFSYFPLKQLFWIVLCLGLPALPARGQSNLSGVIDIHAHVDPDSMPRSIDAIDLARRTGVHLVDGSRLLNLPDLIRGAGKVPPAEQTERKQQENERARRRAWVDAIIDPADTRRLIAEGLHAAAHNRELPEFKTGVFQV